MTQGAILCNPRTKYKRSKNVFAVTPIALSCEHIWARLLQPLAQSLILTPGALPIPAPNLGEGFPHIFSNFGAGMTVF